MNIQKNEPHDIDIGNKMPLKDLRSFVSIHWWQQQDITRGAHNYNTRFNFSQKFGVDYRSYPTLISTITPCMGPYSCKGVCSNSTCISPKHTCSPIWQNHGNHLPFPCISLSWFPPLLLMIFILKWKLL